MEPEAVPMGTSLNFRVERKIVTPGGEWGTPREIIVSLDPLEDEPGLSRNSRVRLSDDKNSVWVTLPPKLLVEESPTSRVLDVVATGKFKVQKNEGSVVSQLLRFLRSQSQDTFLNNTNLALRINIPTERAGDDMDEKTESDDYTHPKRTQPVDRKRKAAEESDQEDEDTDLNDDDDDDDEDEDDEDDEDDDDEVLDITEYRRSLADRLAGSLADQPAGSPPNSRQQNTASMARPRRGQRRDRALPAALQDRVYASQSKIEGAGQGLFANVDFQRGDEVARMGSPALVNLEFQEQAEAQGFPHDSFIHIDKIAGPLKRKRGQLIMDQDFEDVNERPLWYLINHGQREANLEIKYNPERNTFKWIARSFIPKGSELYFNYAPGEKVTFDN